MQYNDPTQNASTMAPMQTAAVNQQAAGIQVPQSIQSAVAGYQPVTPPAVGAGAGQTGAGGGFFKNANGSFNTANAQLVLGGIQTIGSLWNSFQQQKMAKDTFAFNKKAYETNLSNQTSTYNTALEDRIRARYNTEGRSDQADAYIEKNKL
jgi:hypothetical protein